VGRRSEEAGDETRGSVRSRRQEEPTTEVSQGTREGLTHNPRVRQVKGGWMLLDPPQAPGKSRASTSGSTDWALDLLSGLWLG